MRQAPRSSMVHVRALVAAALALGIGLAIAAVAWAAPSVSILSGPSGPTNDTMPVFGFTADADATVDCSIDHGTPDYRPCATTTSHTPDADLADGDWFFRVRATDAALEETEVSQPFTVDTDAPAAPATSGPPSRTNDTTPSFGFTSEPGATFECSVDQGTPAYGPCTAPHTAPVLADGDWLFRVRATDAAGNQGPPASRSFTVDTDAPAAPVISGPPGRTNDTTPSFGFASESGATFECSVDQGTPVYASCTAPYVATLLADGAWEFHVRATDVAGNQGPPASRSFTVDTVAPTVSGVSGPAGPTNDTTPSFAFASEPGATFRCSVDHGTPAYASCAAPYTATMLADGEYTFRVRATDVAGNQGPEVTQDFEVDSEAPSLSIDPGPAFTNDTTPSFRFTAEAGASVECSIDQEEPPYGACSNPPTHVVGTALPEGEHVFLVRAIDSGGNDAIQSRKFTVDTTPPSLSIGFGPSGTTSDSTPLFGFSAEAGATAQCSIDQGTPAYGSCASATTHAAVAPLADGAYVFRVRATDAAGNEAILTRAFTVDTVLEAPDPGSPTPDPTTPTSSGPRLLSPFPLVRLAGTLTPTGARIRLLSVRAPRGALVRVTVSPACGGKKPSSRRCRVRHAAGTVGRRAVLAFRGLAHAYRGGTVIVVRVWSADRIGKYTRFTIRRGKAPRRVDQCLVPGATRGSRCPTS